MNFRVIQVLRVDGILTEREIARFAFFEDAELFCGAKAAGPWPAIEMRSAEWRIVDRNGRVMARFKAKVKR